MQEENTVHKRATAYSSQQTKKNKEHVLEKRHCQEPKKEQIHQILNTHLVQVRFCSEVLYLALCSLVLSKLCVFVSGLGTLLEFHAEMFTN